MRRFARFLLIALPASLLLTSCNDSGSSDNPQQLVAACMATVTGSGARVYANCATSAAGMVSVELFAANVTDEVDAYNIVLNFSPSVFHYMGFSPSETLFAPMVCNGGSVLCVDNANTNANSTGQVVYGVSLTGTNPTGVIPNPGPTRLGRLTFEATSASQTSLAFGAPAMGGCVGSASTGSALMQVNFNDPNNNCVVTVISGITFNQGSVTLSAALY
jgi:hypothetical protein